MDESDVSHLVTLIWHRKHQKLDRWIGTQTLLRVSSRTQGNDKFQGPLVTENRDSRHLSTSDLKIARCQKALRSKNGRGARPSETS